MSENGHLERIIDDRWKLMEHIASGGFGDVYRGEKIVDDRSVAIKIVKGTYRASLENEYEVYNAVVGKNNLPIGFPRIFHYGPCGPGSAYRALVMQRLGKSLDKLCNKYRGLSEVSVLKIGIQLLYRLEHLHSKNYIHCDVKPENMMTGREDSGTIYLVDFGLSAKFRKSRSKPHIKLCREQGFTGTVWFAPLNAHKGKTLSRRDDLQSLAYTLVYLRNGQLPWIHRDIRNFRTDMEVAADMKKSVPVSSLCRGLPEGVVRMFRHVRNLEFEETPDYFRLRDNLLQDLRARQRSDSQSFEWTR